MILVDLNQVVISNLMMQLNKSQKKGLDEPLIRHMILNSLRSYNKKFRETYGEMVVCCDNRKYWRKDVFPFYKSGRKTARDRDTLDWHVIFETLDRVRQELKDNLPHKVIDVVGAEADDIIGVLTARVSKQEPVLILSSDKDFIQLQKYENVTQYSPILKKFISSDNPKNYIKEHIIRGDKGDGIPNFLSSDNVFVIGERQKVINTKKLEEWMKQSVEEICTTDEMLRGYRRNQRLVDLDFTPDNIQQSIVDAYENVEVGNKQKLMNYFIQKRLGRLIEVLDEF
tara:strand:- start:2867 stop:3718 length:852 start_codon:yes stop_codon:yes gene_type:complete